MYLVWSVGAGFTCAVVVAHLSGRGHKLLWRLCCNAALYGPTLVSPIAPFMLLFDAKVHKVLAPLHVSKHCCLECSLTQAEFRTCHPISSRFGIFGSACHVACVGLGPGILLVPILVDLAQRRLSYVDFSLTWTFTFDC